MEQKQAAVGMTKLDRENVYEWKKVKDRITTHLVERAGVPFLQFSLLEETGIVTHAFSTRLGGVSEGVCSYHERKLHPWRQGRSGTGKLSEAGRSCGLRLRQSGLL